jgi:hypothetical protein
MSSAGQPYGQCKRPHPVVAVLTDDTVKDLAAGSAIEFTDRGIHELKGIPGEWRLFAVDRG